MKHEKSCSLFETASAIIPGGVNSPVRACRAVGATPLFIDRAEGSRIYDVDGNGYIDYVGSWGPMILGHRHPAVMKALSLVLDRGTSFGAPTDLEIELARMIVDAVPSIDVVRMVNSGTEATMSTVRLARGATGRPLIIKFDGCYHGHADTLLVDAGSGVATLAIPGSPGIPDAIAALTLSLPYNDLDAVERVMAARGSDVACIIVEPVAGNMGLVSPVDGFLQGLRDICTRAGSLLVFDEVMTGFRVAYGGAQTLYGVMPDLTCLAKVIGGGLPVGAYGGRRDLMQLIAPQGPVYQAGTLSGNPLAMTAGIATLRELAKPGVYERLDAATAALAAGLSRAAADAGIPVAVDRVGSMLGMFFTANAVHDFASAKTSNLDRFCAYYAGMRERGIYLAPSQFEAAFVSLAHSDADITQTVAAAAEVMGALAGTK
ncbi:MAG: glutamate-1-semialdehyde 2,1-aminomutase [Pseudomonadota bacterium]